MIEIRQKDSGERLLTVEAGTLEGADLAQANLVSADLFRALLAGANLQGAHLEGAVLREADLQGAVLRDGYLFRADLRGANLYDGELVCANLQDASLQRANLTNANLRGANLGGAVLADAKLRDANMAGADLRGADLGGATLTNALLDGADMGGCNLHCADLRGADLSRARLQGANLDGAYLTGANIQDALYNHKTRWPDGFNPRPYQRLETGAQRSDLLSHDSGTHVEGLPPMLVREARVVTGRAGISLQVEGKTHCPTIPGVEVLQAQTFINARRTLVVSYNSKEPPGILGYTVVVRPGYNVGDHYHHRREERIIILHGRVEFILQDFRPESPTHELLNLFTVEEPGVCVRIPTGVAHCVVAQEQLAVLQVLASCDYDHSDDVRVVLHRFGSFPFRPRTADAGALFVGAGHDD